MLKKSSTSTIVKLKVQRYPLTTTVRLPESQRDIAELKRGERIEWVCDAIMGFLSWESYANADWTKYPPEDGVTWLDAVELGVEYRVRGKLLPPCEIRLEKDVAIAMEKAESIVQKQRPYLEGKGISSGIIRSAIALKKLNGE